MKNQTKLGMVLSYVTVVIQGLTGIFLTSFLIRILGDNQYGLYSIISALSSNMSILSLGFGTTLVRYVSECRIRQDKLKEKQIVGTVVLFFVFMSFIAFVISGIVYFNFGNIYAKSLTTQEIMQGRWMFLIATINIIITLMETPFSSCLVAYEQYVISRTEIIYKLFMRIIVVIPCILLGANVTIIIIIDTILALTTFAFNIWYTKYKLNIGISINGIELRMVKDIFRYSFFVFLILITNQLNKNVDQTILGIKVSAVAVTVYTAGTKISSLFDSFSNAISNMFIPKATKLVVDGATTKEVEDFVIRFSRIQAYVVFYIYVAFLIMGRGFITIWLGDGYILSWVTAIIVMTGLILPLLKDSIRAYIQASGRQVALSITYLISAFFNVISTWIVVDYFGIIGAAVCSLIMAILCNEVLLNIYFCKVIHLNMFRYYIQLMKGILPVSIVSGIICYLMTKVISVNSIANFILIGSVYTILYFLLMYKCAMNHDEQVMINSIARRIGKWFM